MEAFGQVEFPRSRESQKVSLSPVSAAHVSEFSVEAICDKFELLGIPKALYRCMDSCDQDEEADLAAS